MKEGFRSFEGALFASLTPAAKTYLTFEKQVVNNGLSQEVREDMVGRMNTMRSSVLTLEDEASINEWRKFKQYQAAPQPTMVPVFEGVKVK